MKKIHRCIMLLMIFICVNRICFIVLAEFPLIRCYLRSVGVNIILKKSQIFVASQIILSTVYIFFIYPTFKSHRGRIYCLPIFHKNYDLFLLKSHLTLTISNCKSFRDLKPSGMFYFLCNILI